VNWGGVKEPQVREIPQEMHEWWGVGGKFGGCWWGNNWGGGTDPSPGAGDLKKKDKESDPELKRNPILSTNTPIEVAA